MNSEEECCQIQEVIPTKVRSMLSMFPLFSLVSLIWLSFDESRPFAGKRVFLAVPSARVDGGLCFDIWDPVRA